MRSSTTGCQGGPLGGRGGCRSPPCGGRESLGQGRKGPLAFLQNAHIPSPSKLPHAFLRMIGVYLIAIPAQVAHESCPSLKTVFAAGPAMISEWGTGLDKVAPSSHRHDHRKQPGGVDPFYGQAGLSMGVRLQRSEAQAHWRTLHPASQAAHRSSSGTRAPLIYRPSLRRDPVLFQGEKHHLSGPTILLACGLLSLTPPPLLPACP